MDARLHPSKGGGAAHEFIGPADLPHWRANRLADALAKQAAARAMVPRWIASRVRAAQDGYLHGVASAGVACHAANNLSVQQEDEHGTTRSVAKRDCLPARPRRWPWRPGV